MIAGLDSSVFTPSADIALSAKAAGVGVWSGYLATKPGVKIYHPWTQVDFDNARLCGGTPIAYCSGLDDPVGCKNQAALWNVRLCLDVEQTIRGDGSWVQPWLDASGAGLYGNHPVFAGRVAPFYILAAYPGTDPGVTWPSYYPRPSGPCGWQWEGTHTEFGGGVDRSWLDDWFLIGDDEAVNFPNSMRRGQIREWYQTYLNRQPETEARLQGWADALATDGSNWEQNEYQIISSGEAAIYAAKLQAALSGQSQPGPSTPGKDAEVRQALATLGKEFENG